MEEGVGENVDEGRDIVDEEYSFSVCGLVTSVIYNPINVALLCVIVYLVYQLFSSRKEKNPTPLTEPQLPRLKKQDMTAEQLRKYDGTNEEGRVCMAVNGKIFDVTKGKRFYGPGGPYAAFAGRDATRGLATFSVEVSNKDYDDLSDLNTMQMESVKEWEIQFQERYDYVGRFLKPGEEATDYSDEEENSQGQGSQESAPVDQTSKKETSSKEETSQSKEEPEKEKSSDPDVQEKNSEHSDENNFTIVEKEEEEEEASGETCEKDEKRPSPILQEKPPATDISEEHTKDVPLKKSD